MARCGSYPSQPMIGYLLRLLGFSVAYMAIPNASDVVAKWQQRASAASGDYAAGVQNTDKDPTQLAIAAGPRYLQRVTESFNNGKWANGLRRTGKTGWQAAVASKGVNNFVTGINAATDKATQAFTRLLSYETTLQGQINAMPNNTDADREARMLAWVRGMRNYTG
jgi:hypothetical protein